MKLFCAIVDVKGATFPVDIDAGETVGDLKDVIKAKKPNKIKCDADQLRLFLAKKGDSWLDGAGVAGVTLDGAVPVTRDENGNPQKFVRMDPLLWLSNAKYFGDKFSAGEDGSGRGQRCGRV